MTPMAPEDEEEAATTTTTASMTRKFEFLKVDYDDDDVDDRGRLRLDQRQQTFSPPSKIPLKRYCSKKVDLPG